MSARCAVIFQVWRPDIGEQRADGVAELATDAREAAVKAADYYFHNRDGWEDKWPLMFRVAPSGSEECQDFEVEMEAEPTFCAWPKKGRACVT
jgi:hypothetical protein